MKYAVFICSAYMTGLVSAVPTGPVQVEVVRRSINGHVRSALMVVLGALVADSAYGAVAFFGIAPFMKNERVMAYFWLFGSVLLILLGSLVLRSLRHGRAGKGGSRLLRKKRWGFVGGLTLSISNPMMIIWWLVAAKLFTDFGLIDRIDGDNAVAFITAGVIGLASYLALLALILHRAKTSISDAALRRINIVTAFILFLTGTYFLISSIRHLP